MATGSLQIEKKVKGAFFSIYSFAVIFGLFGIGSSSYNALFTSSLSTLEKRYRFPSSSGGYTMITDNIATVLTSLFIGFHGKTAHKPRWMAAACLITGFSVALTALPYFIFGPATNHDLEIVKNISMSSSNANEKSLKPEICLSNPIEERCDKQSISDAGYVTFVALICFGASNFLRGLGTSIFFTYGSPYLDDNVSKSKMPIIMACVFASRLFGAPMGLLMASFSLRYYENPFSPPSDINQTDPTWIGAWWLGFISFGLVLMLLAIPLSLFPAEFKKKTKNADEKNESQIKDSNNDATQIEIGGDSISKEAGETKTQHDTSLKNLPKEVYALVKNPIIVCQLLGNMFKGIGLLGFYVFQTKYVENQFSQTASRASFITGTTGFPAKIAGVLLGGIIITGLKPGPRTLTSYIFMVEVTSVLFLIGASTFIGPQYSYPNTHMDPETGHLNLLDKCNKDCHCDNVRYQPVCDVSSGSMAFFSPCHAGCHKSYHEADDELDENFADCSCIPQGTEVSVLRKCNSDHNNPVERYARTVGFAAAFTGSARTGNTITLLRATEPDQKAMAIALSSFWHSLVVSIPYPILYGKLFDWSCIFWQRECAKQGNCWMYDTERLRANYHYVTIGFFSIGIMLDFLMIFLSPRLQRLYDDEGKKPPFLLRIFRSSFGAVRGCLFGRSGPNNSSESGEHSPQTISKNQGKSLNWSKPQETDLDKEQGISNAPGQLEQFDLPERPQIVTVK